MNALLFDPYLFHNWEITDETMLALTSLRKFVFSGVNHGNYQVFSCKELEAEYITIFQEVKLKDRFIERFIQLLISNSQPIGETQVDSEVPNLPFNEFPEIHRILLKLVASNPNIVVILAEKEQYPYSPLYEMKEQICVQLKREALVSLSDFTSMLNVFTEGKTDWMHLKAALCRFKEQGKYLGLQIDFIKTTPGSGEGWTHLLKHCIFLSYKPEERSNIFIFDRDVQSKLLKSAEEEIKRAAAYFQKYYHHWGNKVFSCMLPIPSHRCETPDYVCIEFYYTDFDLVKKDKDGNRLFLDSEFIHGTGTHKTEHLQCRHHRKDIPTGETQKPTRILSRDDVTNFEHRKVGLSKSKFAENVLIQALEFQNMDINEFAKIFDLICDIRNAAKGYG